MNLQLLATKLTDFTYSPPPLQLVSVLTLSFLQGKTLVPVIEKSHTVWLIRESWEVQHKSIRGARLSFISSDRLNQAVGNLDTSRHILHPFFLPVFYWFKYGPAALSVGFAVGVSERLDLGWDCVWLEKGKTQVQLIVLAWISRDLNLLSSCLSAISVAASCWGDSSYLNN